MAIEYSNPIIRNVDRICCKIIMNNDLLTQCKGMKKMGQKVDFRGFPIHDFFVGLFSVRQRSSMIEICRGEFLHSSCSLRNIWGNEY